MRIGVRGDAGAAPRWQKFFGSFFQKRTASFCVLFKRGFLYHDDAAMSETAWACDALTPATDADVADVVALMNRAYRPRGGEAGWSNETDYIDGDRTSEDLLRREIAGNPGARLLIWRRPDEDLQGCVWLEPLADDTWYLGSLTIEPRAQNGGVGRGLLAAAEEWVRAQGGRAIRMTVVQVRESLIAWYVRRGYRLTGDTKPFP